MTICRAWKTFASVAAISLGLAAPTLARPYVNGVYSGTVRQAVPHSYAGTITFHVHGHKLTGLRFSVTMVCSRALIAQVQAPTSTLKIKVTKKGKFLYTGTVAGTKLKLRGKVHGHKASGTFFESFRTAPGHHCSMLAPAPFHTRV